MKRSSKVVKILCMYFGLVCLFANPMLGRTVSSMAETVNVSEGEITTYDAITGWRYKVEDGKLYKRLYNYGNNTWIGDWILIP